LIDDPATERAQLNAIAAECRSVLGAVPTQIVRLTHSRVTRGVWRVNVVDGAAGLAAPPAAGTANPPTLHGASSVGDGLAAPPTADPGAGPPAAGPPATPPASTAIVKVLTPPPTGSPESDDPGSWRYWLREAEACAAGTPEPYRTAGVRSPKLFARIDRSDGDVALWMEDVQGQPAADWDLPAFARAARRLGRAQGAYATGTPLPSDPWLSRDFLRRYLAARRPTDDALLADAAAWAHPMIARHFGAGLRGELLRLRADRERLLGWMAAAPRTYAHLDVWPDNLFETASAGPAAGGDSAARAAGIESGNAAASPSGLVLIDWGFAGIGVLGEDIGNLIPDSVFDLRHPPSILRALDRTVFEAYLTGLRDAGWHGDERLVRLAICASACKYDWIAGATLARAATDSPTQPIYGRVEVDADLLFETRAHVLAFLAEWAAEARSLAGSLGLP
jgi:hypothetical protein